MLKLFYFTLFFTLSAPELSAKVQTIRGQTMGTYYQVKISSPKKVDIVPLRRKIESKLLEVNKLFSTYMVDSEISVVNKLIIGKEHKLSSRFSDMMRLSLEIHRQSNGYFDPSIGPLVHHYGFGVNGKKKQPAGGLKYVAGLTGMKAHQFGSDLKTIKLLKPHAFLDLSAIAKGQGVDEVAELLRMNKFVDFMVDIGGEIYVSGIKTKAAKWVIGVEKPIANTRGAVQKRLELQDEAIATSGNYRNFKKIDLSVVSHTMDPVAVKRTNHGLLSVSVIHKSCAVADAWATAFMAMGPETFIQLADRHKLLVYGIVNDGKSFKAISSQEFVKRFEGKAAKK